MSNTTQIQKHAISLLVANKPGVLIRISLVFSRRGFNLDSVVVSPTHDPQFSRMNIEASGDPSTLDQILHQLNKLVDVIHAKDHTGENIMTLELLLVKVSCSSVQRIELLQIADHFKCRSIDLTEESISFEVTGTTEKLDALHQLLSKFGIIEYIRSGKLIMTRGSNVT